MNSEAKVIRQYAELIRAGNRINVDSTKFSKQTAIDLENLLTVTRQVGGPLANTLDRFANVLLTREQSKNELDLAVAGPKASSRLVMSLPVLVFLGAGISGIPVFRTLFSPSLVWVSFALGALLFTLGNRWTNKLLNAAEPRVNDPGLPLDAMAIAAQAGLPLAAAREIVTPIVGEFSWVELPESNGGVAVTQLLHDRANSLRLEQFNQDRLAIQKTSVKVLWPLGVTVLPAFVLLAIVPIGAALIGPNH